MEEIVALDSSKQKQFVKSIKGIKKLLKENDTQLKLDKQKDKGGKFKKNTKKRGLVYLSHIPHGFYEHQMTQYFKQFGVVTNVRVIRSKRTGNSKGHAFVEFKEPAVGQIVAETMNNYLMGKRLIKAVYIPPEEQKRNAMRKRWNSQNNPGNNYRLKMKKAYNETKDDLGELKRARKLLTNLLSTKKKLSELGIDYDFFLPVDVPEQLLSKIVKQEKDEDESVKVKKENVKSQETIVETMDKKLKDKKDVKIIKKEIQLKNKKNNVKIESVKVVPPQSDNKQKKAKAEKVIDSKTNKQKNLAKKELKPLEDFIKIQQEAHSDDDSTYEFDSDEYEKMIKNDNDSSDADTNDEDSDNSADNIESVGSVDSDSHNSDEEVNNPVSNLKVLKMDTKKASQMKTNPKSKPEVKRKAPQKNSGPPKKGTFEKPTGVKKVNKKKMRK